MLQLSALVRLAVVGLVVSSGVVGANEYTTRSGNRWTNLPMSSNIEDRRWDGYATFRVEVSFNTMEMYRAIHSND